MKSRLPVPAMGLGYSVAICVKRPKKSRELPRGVRWDGGGNHLIPTMGTWYSQKLVKSRTIIVLRSPVQRLQLVLWSDVHHHACGRRTLKTGSRTCPFRVLSGLPFAGSHASWQSFQSAKRTSLLLCFSFGLGISDQRYRLCVH